MRRSHLRVSTVLALALVAGLAACDDDIIAPPGPEDVTFAPELGVDLDAMTKLPSGVYIQTLEAGAGAMLGEDGVVVLDYTGWLADGQEFDSGTDVRFELDEVVAGFAIGLEGVQEDETRLMVIPSGLAYGPGGSPPLIPGNAVLVFRVHIDQVNPPT